MVPALPCPATDSEPSKNEICHRMKKFASRWRRWWWRWRWWSIDYSNIIPANGWYRYGVVKRGEGRGKRQSNQKSTNDSWFLIVKKGQGNAIHTARCQNATRNPHPSPTLSKASFVVCRSSPHQRQPKVKVEVKKKVKSSQNQKGRSPSHQAKNGTRKERKGKHYKKTKRPNVRSFLVSPDFLPYWQRNARVNNS